MQQEQPSRRIISIVLFILAVILIVVGILVPEQLGMTGVLLGVAAAIVGLIFYRRGK